MNNLRLVHVVFKSHLDIGFTDLAARVTENYLNRFIPAAIKTAQELRQRGGPERFVWTTGSWLIHTCLKRYDEKNKEVFTGAIERGDIAWHALPFTTHTELMDAELFDHGLSLSADLDRRFGRTTSAGKMTDVPGHTIGVVPLLAARGIKYLHIGVNGCSHLPETPRVFRWRAADGNEILIQYDKCYGETLILPGMDEALVIVNAGDNQGPPSADAVIRVFAQLSERFPGVEIRASTLDAFLPALLKAEGIPVFTEEIGDTWIHGIATDPLKVAKFKELLRIRNAWTEQGKLCPESKEYRDFCDELLIVCEHTWGFDSKGYLADYTHWSADDFQNARKADKVEIPAGISEFSPFLPHPEQREKLSYSFFESSHREQRAYIEAAVSSLPGELQNEIENSFRQLTPRRELEDGISLYPGEAFSLGPWRAIIGDNGSLVSLKNADGRELAGKCGIGAYSYQTFSYEDYVKYHHDYNRNIHPGIWAFPDFGKPGMQYAKPYPEHAFFNAHIQSIRLNRHEEYDEAAVLLRSSADDPRGAPGTLIIRFRGIKKTELLELSLDWFDKEASRLPEAIWFSIGLNAENPERWRFSKLGSLINPFDVVKGGNRSYHGIEYAEYAGGEGRYRITPLDSPVAAPGTRKMLQFDERFEDPAGGIHLNIYNNIWGTNFPLWYEEDGRSRVIVDFNA